MQYRSQAFSIWEEKASPFKPDKEQESSDVRDPEIAFEILREEKSPEWD